MMDNLLGVTGITKADKIMHENLHEPMSAKADVHKEDIITPDNPDPDGAILTDIEVKAAAEKTKQVDETETEQDEQSVADPDVPVVDDEMIEVSYNQGRRGNSIVPPPRLTYSICDMDNLVLTQLKVAKELIKHGVLAENSITDEFC